MTERIVPELSKTGPNQSSSSREEESFASHATVLSHTKRSRKFIARGASKNNFLFSRLPLLSYVVSKTDVGERVPNMVSDGSIFKTPIRELSNSLKMRQLLFDFLMFGG